MVKPGLYSKNRVLVVTHKQKYKYLVCSLILTIKFQQKHNHNLPDCHPPPEFIHRSGLTFRNLQSQMRQSSHDPRNIPAQHKESDLTGQPLIIKGRTLSQK